MYDLIAFQLNDTLCYPVSPYAKVRAQIITKNIATDKNFDCDYSLLQHVVINMQNCLNCTLIKENRKCAFEQQISVGWAGEHILYPGVIKFLTSLKEQNKAKIVLLVNGRDIFRQAIIQQLNLAPYFDHIFGSNRYQGHYDKEFFDKTAGRFGVNKNNCMFLSGGVEASCINARKAGWDALYVNPKSSNSYLYGLELLEAAEDYKNNYNQHNVCWGG